MSQPTLKFLFSHPAHFFAQGLGSGLSPWAPGTAGTLFGWASFALFIPFLPDAAFAIAWGIAFVLGIAAIHKTGRDLGVTDHGSIVWDEIVPFWGLLFFTPHGFFWQLAAFLLFRVLDIVKPWPACYFDQKVHNGFGVMMDDVFAALYALILILGAQWLLA
jgi:phosphatidylglycerophosphatase A